MVHRDVKPLNLVLDEEMRSFKLIDLGACVDLRSGYNFVSLARNWPFPFPQDGTNQSVQPYVRLLCPGFKFCFHSGSLQRCYSAPCECRAGQANVSS